MNKATDLLAMLFASMGAKPAPLAVPGAKAPTATDAFRTLLDAAAPPGEPPPTHAPSARPAIAEGALPEAAAAPAPPVEKKDEPEEKAEKKKNEPQAMPLLVLPIAQLPQPLEQQLVTKTEEQTTAPIKLAHEPALAARSAPAAQGIAPTEDRRAAQPEQQPAAQPTIDFTPVAPHAHSQTHSNAQHRAPKHHLPVSQKIDDTPAPTSATTDAQPTQPPAPKVQARTPIERLTHTVKNVVRVVARNGQSEARITVEPAHLGRVDVRLHADRAGTVTVELRATSPEASETLAQALPELRRALEDGGLQIGGIEVRTQAEDLPQGRQQQDQQQDARGGSNGSAPEIEEEAFDEVHEQELGLVDVLA